MLNTHPRPVSSHSILVNRRRYRCHAKVVPPDGGPFSGYVGGRHRLRKITRHSTTIEGESRFRSWQPVLPRPPADIIEAPCRLPFAQV